MKSAAREILTGGKGGNGEINFLTSVLSVSSCSISSWPRDPATSPGDHATSPIDEKVWPTDRKVSPTDAARKLHRPVGSLGARGSESPASVMRRSEAAARQD